VLARAFSAARMCSKPSDDTPKLLNSSVAVPRQPWSSVSPRPARSARIVGFEAGQAWQARALARLARQANLA